MVIISSMEGREGESDFFFLSLFYCKVKGGWGLSASEGDVWELESEYGKTLLDQTGFLCGSKKERKTLSG